MQQRESKETARATAAKLIAFVCQGGCPGAVLRPEKSDNSTENCEYCGCAMLPFYDYNNDVEEAPSSQTAPAGNDDPFSAINAYFRKLARHNKKNHRQKARHQKWLEKAMGPNTQDEAMRLAYRRR